MEKKDLYLSDEQIWDCASKVYKRWADPPMPGDMQYGEFRQEVEREISQTSADYAVKRIIGELDDALNDATYYDHRLWRVGEIVGKLKKLIET